MELALQPDLPFSSSNCIFCTWFHFKFKIYEKIAARCSVPDCRMVALRLFFSSLAPLIWISMALLKVSYYECIVAGSPWNYTKEKFCRSNDACLEEILLLPCASTLKRNFSKKAIEEIQKHVKTETQVNFA